MGERWNQSMETIDYSASTSSQPAKKTGDKRRRNLRVLFIFPGYLSTKPGLDPLWLETAGLAQGLGKVVARCDVLTPYGLFEPAHIKSFASQRATPSILRQPLHRLPRVIRVLLGDGRSWWRAQVLKRRAVAAARAAPYQLVIQFHRRFHSAGYHAAKQCDAPMVLKMDALEVREEEEWGIHRPWGSVVERFGESRIMERADLVAPVSAELNSLLSSMHIPDHKRLVLDNAVDLDLFSPATDSHSKRPPELGSRIVAGWIGSFRPFHGLNLLPDIAARLEADSPDVLLCLVGDGPQFQSVATSVRGRSNVVLVGAVAHEEVPAWIRCFDMAFVLANQGAFHYSPLKLYEYLASGCPVIAPDVGELAQVIQRERGGLLVPPGRPDAVADAIIRLARGDDFRRRMALEARQVAESSGSWEARAERLLSSLEDRGLL